MDRRFLALTAAAFVLAFALCWVWFAPARRAPVPEAANAPPAAAPSNPALDQPPLPSQDPPPPPPTYEAEPDPTVVHRLG